MAKHEVVKRDTKVPDGPPRPPPSLVAKAMPKQRLKAQSFIPSIMPDVHCLYFSIVAIQPYEPAAGEEHMSKIRKHYLDGDIKCGSRCKIYQAHLWNMSP